MKNFTIVAKHCFIFYFKTSELYRMTHLHLIGNKKFESDQKN